MRWAFCFGFPWHQMALLGLGPQRQHLAFAHVDPPPDLVLCKLMGGWRKVRWYETEEWPLTPEFGCVEFLLCLLWLYDSLHVPLYFQPQFKISEVSSPV